MIEFLGNPIVALMAAIIAGCSVLYWHFSGAMRSKFWLALAMSLLSSSFYTMGMMMLAGQVDFLMFLALLSLYGCTLFVGLSEWMTRGLAQALTARRGEHWVKEIDYFYLGLGAVGVILSLNRMEGLTSRVGVPDALGPLIITTALVLRLLKTRAEINGWNKVPPRVASGPTSANKERGV